MYITYNKKKMSLDSFQQNMYYDSANTPPPLLNYFLVWLWLKLIFFVYLDQVYAKY
jgi:hypothetical protein